MLHNYFEQLPIELQIVWILSVVLGIIIVGLIIFLKILRNILKQKDFFRTKYQHKYEEELLSYLFEESEEGELNSKQKDFIQSIQSKSDNPFKRKIIVNTLLKLKNEVSGEIEIAIQNLYLNTNLKKYAYQQLKSNNWVTVANAVKELTQFKVAEAYPKIKKLHKYPKKEVRKEVELYLVSLFHFKGLEFLTNLKINLSEWDQMELLEELQKLDNQEIPDITVWLNSKNDSVVSFSLKLAKIYNKYETVETLLKLLNHKNQKIRLQVIEVLTHLQMIDAKPILKKKFKNSSEEEQVAIFKFLDQVYESDDESFIVNNCEHSNFEIQYLAFNMLKIINENGFNNLIKKNNQFKGNVVLKYVKDN